MASIWEVKDKNSLKAVGKIIYSLLLRFLKQRLDVKQICEPIEVNLL